MALALNKTTLKQQRDQSKTYKQFLPSLELKRQQLLAALKTARREKQAIDEGVAAVRDGMEELFPLLGSSTIASRNIASLISISALRIEQENLLGTQLPVVREVAFETQEYSKFVTPFWVDGLVSALQQLATLGVEQQDRALDMAEALAKRVFSVSP